MDSKFDDISLLVLEGFMDSMQKNAQRLQAQVEAKKAELRDQQDEIAEIAQAIKIKEGELRWETVQALGKEWRRNHPEEHAAFLAEIHERNRAGMVQGAELGWWDLDENGEPLSPPQVFKLSDFQHVNNATLGHVMHAAGLFPSVGQAKKNGWSGGLEAGEWTVTKKKIRIRIVD
jgi:hypothetical protein